VDAGLERSPEVTDSAEPAAPPAEEQPGSDAVTTEQISDEALPQSGDGESGDQESGAERDEPVPDDLGAPAPPESPPQEAAPQDPPEIGSSNGSGTAAPPWQRVGTSPEGGIPAPAKLTVAQPERDRDTGGSKAGQQQPATQAYGFSSASQGGSPAGANRYGHPVAQPLDSQPSWGENQDFSRPTVRFGGRVQPEPPPAQPSIPPRVRPTRVPRRASLQLRYLEPWSVLKVSLVLSVAGFLAWMVAVGVLYSILAGMGVWDQLNGTYSDLTSVSNPQASQDLISAGGVFGVAALIGLVNIVLITAMCTVGAFIYNASADLAGGIEVTLSERD
jgi:hypothetical protein